MKKHRANFIVKNVWKMGWRTCERVQLSLSTLLSLSSRSSFDRAPTFLKEFPPSLNRKVFFFPSNSPEHTVSVPLCPLPKLPGICVIQDCCISAAPSETGQQPPKCTRSHSSNQDFSRQFKLYCWKGFFFFSLAVIFSRFFSTFQCAVQQDWKLISV